MSKMLFKEHHVELEKKFEPRIVLFKILMRY